MALVAIVLVGIFAGVANLASSRIMQAEREEELLFRGQAYRAAIRHFYEAEGHYPRSLRELLKDPHFTHRVYLRALYVDPMASEAGRKQSGGGGPPRRGAAGPRCGWTAWTTVRPPGTCPAAGTGTS